MPMTVVACFPLSIIQAASCRCDAFVFSFTFIVIAYLCYMYKAKDYSLTKKNILTYTILVLILGLSKVTFGALILLILIIPKNKFKNPRDYYLGIISIIFILSCLLCWSKFYAADGIVHSWRKVYFKQNHVNSTEQLSYMTSHPEVISTFSQIGTQLPIQIDALTRYYSDYPNIPVLSYLYAIFSALFVLLYPIKEKVNINKRLFIAFTLAVIILGTYIVQYLTWAPVGSVNLIEAGVVPRYFMPTLVLLPIIFNINNKEIKNKELIVITTITIFLSSSIMFIATMLY